MAAQDALVIANRAVIYSDVEMTSPVGYVAKGKKIRVGEVPRNMAQVYPIIVSGKVAYIRLKDISTHRREVDSNKLVAQRFTTEGKPSLEKKFSLSYFSFASVINSSAENAIIKNGDLVLWNGVSLKGEVLAVKGLDIQLIANYLNTRKTDETYNVFEMGPGVALRLINTKRFLTRLEGHLFLIPFSNYSVSNDFRVNSYGYSTGANLNLNYIFNKNTSLEIYGGVFTTKLTGFEVPAPYKLNAPIFLGTRLGMGLSFTF